MEFVFFDKQTGRVTGVHHKPELLSDSEKKEGLMVNSFSPPSESDDYFDWEARVVDSKLVWQKKGKPVGKFAFRKLFSLDELSRIKTGDGIQSQDLPILEVIREDLELFDNTPIDDPHVVELINWLNQKGVIATDQRKQEILKTSEPAMADAESTK